MSVQKAQREFLEAAVERLAGDDRVAAVLLVGSAGRGEADEWSDLDIEVIADDDYSSEVASNPHAAEQFGDLLVWVDCSFNAVLGGTMAFSRYQTGAGLLMVDWHVFPHSTGRFTAGARVLWSRPNLELQRFEGNVVDLVASNTRRSIPPYSRQQRARVGAVHDRHRRRPPAPEDTMEETFTGSSVSRPTQDLTLAINSTGWRRTSTAYGPG